MWPFKKESQRRSLTGHLLGLKTVIISDIEFQIRRLDVSDYLEGARVLHETFSVYKSKKQQEIEEKSTTKSINKAKDYMRDVIMAGVVSPKLTRVKEEAKEEIVFVDEMFRDWALAQSLVSEILKHTYGKKK